MTNIDENVVAEPHEPKTAPESEPVAEEPQGPTVGELQKQLEESQAEAAKFKRMAERKAKKAEKSDSAPSKETSKDGLDYGEKAYLKTEGIQAGEMDWVQERFKESGLNSLEDLLANGFFQHSLKEMRDKAAVQEAMPEGTRTNNVPANTKAEYWVNKGELPPNTPENQQLRRDVVNARMKRESGPRYWDN